MRVFGLIGFPLSHSFSKKYFTRKFAEEGFNDCVYENFEIPSIKDFTNLLLHNPSLNGLNVTIPYKEQVIPFLSGKNEVVEKIGACNCIKFEGGKLYGFNTDTIGFEQSLRKKLLSRHDKALILGTGGAAKAIAYVMEKLGIHYYIVSRKSREANFNISSGEGQQLQYHEIPDELLQSHLLIVNTTPLGMYPDVDAAPPINYNLLTPNHYLFDLIYNPEKTLFLKKGEEKGAVIENGHEMLVVQAEESWKIWNKGSSDF